MLTAKHCFTANRDAGFGANIQQPVSVTTADRNRKYWFNTALYCTPTSSDCMLPPDKTKSNTTNNDVLGFAPDTATPTAMVQTKRGLLPVLDPSRYRVDKRVLVCHYGQTSGQKCGHLHADGPDGLGDLHAGGRQGDSGGPVYQYVSDAHGHLKGVLVLGVAVQANNSDTRFVKTAAILQMLNAALVTAPPLR